MIRELRDLDAWIAERVMKLRRCGALANLAPGEFFYDSNVFITRPGTTLIVQFHPSEDPWSAMLLLARMNDDLHDVILHRAPSGQRAASKLQRYSFGWASDFTTLAPTMELSVALMAKKLYS